MSNVSTSSYIKEIKGEFEFRISGINDLNTNKDECIITHFKLNEHKLRLFVYPNGMDNSVKSTDELFIGLAFGDSTRRFENNFVKSKFRIVLVNQLDEDKNIINERKYISICDNKSMKGKGYIKRDELMDIAGFYINDIILIKVDISIFGDREVDENNTIDESINTVDESSNIIDESSNTIDESTNTVDESSNTVDESSNSVDESSNIIDISNNTVDTCTNIDEK